MTYRDLFRRYIPCEMEDYYCMLIPICFGTILALLHKYHALMSGLPFTASLTLYHDLSYFSLARSTLCFGKSYHIAEIFTSCA